MTEPSDSGVGLRYYDRPVDQVAAPAYAGIFERLLALWLDHAIALALTLLIGGAPAFAYAILSDDLGAAISALLVLSLFVEFAYQLMATFLGGGWGKRWLGLRIVRDRDGQRPGGGTALARVAVIFALTLIPVIGWLLYVADCAWALGDDRRQAWHDRLAGTLVVKQGRPER